VIRVSRAERTSTHRDLGVLPSFFAVKYIWVAISDQRNSGKDNEEREEYDAAREGFEWVGVERGCGRAMVFLF
jgi:hypothetical protein